MRKLALKRFWFSWVKFLIRHRSAIFSTENIRPHAITNPIHKQTDGY